MQAFDFVLGGRRSDGSLNGVARGDGGLAGGFLPVVFAARVDDGAAGVDHHAGAFGGLAGLNAGADVAALSADPRHEQGKVRRDAAHVGEFGGIGGADDEAEFAVEVPLGGGKARKAFVDLLAVHFKHLDVVAAGVGGAAEDEHALALLGAVRQIRADGIQAHVGGQCDDIGLKSPVKCALAYISAVLAMSPRLISAMTGRPVARAIFSVSA